MTMKLEDLDTWAKEAEQDQQNDIRDAIKARIREAKTGNVLKFPVQVFPSFCQEMIKAYHRCFGASPDHYGLTMLSVAGAVLGNAVWAVERGNTHPPLFYSVIVDKPGRGKTPIIRTVLKPLLKIEQKYRAEHAEALRMHRDTLAKNPNATPPSAPVGKELILNDFTLESVFKVLMASPRGVIVFRDEITGWLNSMNAYKTKGSDEQFWLENYNSGLVKINRKNSDRPTFVKNSFVAVLGTTQPGMLTKFSEGDKAQNGFLARILFSYPEDTEKMCYSAKNVASDYAEKWQVVIDRLYELPCAQQAAQDEFSDSYAEPTLVGLSPSAAELYQRYYDDVARQVNESQDEVEQSTLTKFDSHVLRLALVLHFLHWAEENGLGMSEDELKATLIGDKAMRGAIELAKYFQATALKVVGRLSSPAQQLPSTHQTWYNALPLDTEIKREMAVETGKEAQISERTVARLLSRPDLFRRLRQGAYERICF
jgi:Protein of unknown function (DUF3987)